MSQKTESNATQVVLTKLELEAAGEYSCEVSADAPSFHTALVYATMNIVGKCVHVCVCVSALCVFSSVLTLARSWTLSCRTLITLAAGTDCVKTRLESYYPARFNGRACAPRTTLTAHVSSYNIEA